MCSQSVSVAYGVHVHKSRVHYINFNFSVSSLVYERFSICLYSLVEKLITGMKQQQTCSKIESKVCFRK